MKDKLCIFGASQFAEVAFYYLKKQYEIINFVVDNLDDNPKKLFDVEIISTDEFLKKYKTNEIYIYIAIAQSKLSYPRKYKYLYFKKLGYKFITYVDDSVKTYDNQIGENTFIFEGCLLSPFSNIGNNCILWQGAVIGHHSIISDHCFLAGPSVLSGNSKLDENVYLGVNSTVRDGVKIGKNSFIGARSLIMKEVQPNSIYFENQSSKTKVSSLEFFKVKDNN